MAYEMIQESAVCPGNLTRTLQLPIVWDANASDEYKAHMTKLLSKLNLYDRLNIKKMMACNLNINRLIGVSHTIERHNLQQGKRNFALSMALGGKAAIEGMRYSTIRYKGVADRFHGAIAKLDHYQRDRIAGKLTAAEFKSAAAGDYQEAVKSMQSAAKLGMIHARTARYLNSLSNVGRMATRRIFIGNLSDAAHLVKVAKTAKFMGNGLWAIGAAAGADEVYNTYKQGGNWEKQAEGVSMELAVTGTVAEWGGELIGAFLLGSNPVGWAVLAVSGIAAGVAAFFASGMAKDIGDGIYDVGQDIGNWAVEYAKKWF